MTELDPYWCFNRDFMIYSWRIKGLNKQLFNSKNTLITSGVDGAGLDPPLCKTGSFFFGPCLLVRQLIEIFNQMELNGEFSNFEIFLYNRVYL